MKMNLKMLLCLVLAMMLIVAGCSKQSETQPEETSKAETSEETSKEDGSQAESAEDESAETAGDYDENGVSPEGTFPIVADIINLKVMLPNTSSITDLNTNTFTQWYEDLTNVHVDWNVIPSDSLTEKVNISLSSGDMPDVYMNCGVTQTQQMVYGMQGAFAPLNDYIDKYGATFKTIESEVDGLESVITMSDGNIYALPYIEKCVHCENSSKLWVNQNWLDVLGLSAPTTVEEFESMLKDFAAKDPNGNGAADEIPLVAFEGGWKTNIMSGYLTDPFVYTDPDNHYVYLENGEIKLSYMQDGWKEAMQWLHSLYENQLLYDQSLIMNYDQAVQLGASGDGIAIVGAFPGGVPSTVPGSEVDQWNAYVAISPIEGSAGRYATWGPYNSINPTNFVITSTCNNPAAAFRWGVEQYNRDINFRKVFGEEGTGWVFITPGEGDVPADAKDLNTGLASEVATFADGVQWGDEQNYCWRGNGPRCETADAPEYRYNQYQIGDYETNMEYRLAYDTRDNYQPFNPDISICLPPLVYDEAQATTLANTQSVIETYVNEMTARFISGDADIDGEWDNYINELNVKGVEDLIGIYQAAYDAKYK